MKSCQRCNNNFAIESKHTYHDVYKCIVCNYLLIVRIEECCSNSFLCVTVDDKNPDRRRLHRQCLTCGGCMDRSQPLSFKFFFKDVRYEFSHTKYQKWLEEVNNERSILWDNIKLRNFESSKYEKYKSYLKSNTWIKKRSEVLIRDNYLCRVCGYIAHEVHHISYENLFNENLEDLLSVCKKCHEEIHVLLNKKYIEELKGKLK